MRAAAWQAGTLVQMLQTICCGSGTSCMPCCCSQLLLQACVGLHRHAQHGVAKLLGGYDVEGLTLRLPVTLLTLFVRFFGGGEHEHGVGVATGPAWHPAATSAGLKDVVTCGHVWSTVELAGAQSS